MSELTLNAGNFSEAERWPQVMSEVTFHPLSKESLTAVKFRLIWLLISLLQVLKGGQEAPTKPKGRPKKNSIPTSEEIEAEEKMNSQAQSQEAEGSQAPEEPKVTEEKPEVSLETEESPEHIAEPSSEEVTPLS